MRFDKIDIIKSKLHEKVVRKTWLIEPMYDFFMYTILICFFPFLAGFNLFYALEYDKDMFIPTLLLLLALTSSGLLLYVVLNLSTLNRIKGHSKKENRDLVKNALEELNWTIFKHNQELTVSSPKYNWFSANWERELTIIYDQKDILINVTVFGRFDIKSPFHWFGNKKYEKIFETQFRKRQETTNR